MLAAAVARRPGPRATRMQRVTGSPRHRGGLRYQLEPTGVTLEQLRAAPGGVRVQLQTRHAKHAEADANGTPPGFATPSRRVELFSQVFLDHGYAPLPDFVEPPIGPVARPDLAARFPLILTSAKSSVFCESQHRGLRSLRKHEPHPAVALHPTAAKARGIAHGDWVTIETPEASVRARARLAENLDPELWWASTGGGRAVSSSACRAMTRSSRQAPTSTCSSVPPRAIQSAERRRISPICARSDPSSITSVRGQVRVPPSEAADTAHCGCTGAIPRAWRLPSLTPPGFSRQESRPQAAEGAGAGQGQDEL